MLTELRNESSTVGDDTASLRASGFGIRAHVALLTLVPVVCLVVILALAAALNLQTVALSNVANRTVAALAGADTVLRALSDASRSVESFERANAARDVAAYHTALRQLSVAEAALDASLPADAAVTASAHEFESSLVPGITILAAYVRMIEARNAAGLHRIRVDPATRAASVNILNGKRDLDLSVMVWSRTQGALYRSRVEALGRWMLIVTAAGIALSVFFALRYGWHTVRRLQRLADNAWHLAAGHAATPLEGDDEIARLDAMYRRMMRRLSDSMRERADAVAAFEQQYDVASTLQHALLPASLPEISGLRLDAAYVTAGAGSQIGGDWYDVFRVADHVVGISIGDVAGHGLRAATIMGAVRQSIRTAARIDSDPGRVLRHVNRSLCFDKEDAIVTGFFGLLDLRGRTLRYAIAGHGSPFLVKPGPHLDLLAGSGLLLGVDPEAEFECMTAHVDVGSALVFYTDGIVELERDYLGGIRELEAAVEAEYPSAADNIAQAIQERVLRERLPRDDSAILFVGVTNVDVDVSNNVRLVWKLDARDQLAVHQVKRGLLWHVGRLCHDRDAVAALELAYGELLSNVARHTPGVATVALEMRRDKIVLHVDDAGEPFHLNGHAPPSETAEGGRGLFLLHALSSELSLHRTHDGNRLSVTLPIVPADARPAEETAAADGPAQSVALT